MTPIISKVVHHLESGRNFNLSGWQHLLLHTHKMPALNILFSLVCFPVSTSALGTGLFFTPEAHKRSVDQCWTRRKGVGENWQGEQCLSSPKDNYLCTKMPLAGAQFGTRDQSTEKCFMLRDGISPTSVLLTDGISKVNGATALPLVPGL